MPSKCGERSYTFHYGVPGMYLELYLPTKFEGLLQVVLDKGFDIDHVREQLKDQQHIADIRRLLKKHSSLHDYDAKRVDDFNTVSNGYSLYRVAGAFKGDANSIVREEVSVARLVFLPPALNTADDGDSEENRFASRRYLRFWTHRIETYLLDRGNDDPVPEDERVLIERLHHWLEDVGLFMNGYVLYRVCEEICDWLQTDKIDEVEDEIWVTSFRTLAVNKLIFPKRNVKEERSTEDSMAARIECIPDRLILSPGQRADVTVVSEGGRDGELWAPFGHSTNVVMVTSGSSGSQTATPTNGVAAFTVTGRNAGATTINFGVTDGNVCRCTVTVTRATVAADAALVANIAAGIAAAERLPGQGG